MQSENDLAIPLSKQGTHVPHNYQKNIKNGRLLAKELECDFMCTSARTGYNTQAAFEQICRLILIA